MEQPPKKRNNFAGILVVGLLFVVPALSYFILRTGFNYQKEAYEMLDSLGVSPAYQFVDQHGSTIDTAALSGKAIVFTVFPEDRSQTEAMVGNLNRLYEQFDQTLRVHVLTVAPTRELEDPRALVERYGVIGKSGWSLVAATPSDIEKLVRRMPSGYAPGKIALIDRYGFVRRFYDPTLDEDMALLIRHLTFVLPPDEDEEVELVRAREK